MTTAEVRVRVAANVFAREFDGELVIVDLEHGDYFGLDDLGRRAWDALAAGQNPREIAAALVSEYDVDVHRLEADLVQLVTALLAQGLVVRA